MRRHPVRRVADRGLRRAVRVAATSMLLAGIAVAAEGPATASAQEPADSTAGVGSACVFPARPDSLSADSTAADSSRTIPLVEWPAPDSVVQSMLDREGYVATRYCADTVAFDPRSGTLRLVGNAAVERDGTVLVGDSILFSDSTRTLYAFAAPGRVVRLRDLSQADDILAERIQYDIDRRTGIVLNVRTSVLSGDRWFIQAHRAAPQLADSTTGGRSAFFGIDGSLTSCNLAEPHYHFEARQLKMITDNIMVVRPAIVYIADIPVMWLPFVFQDMRDGRRSGLLAPQLGFTDIVRNSPTYRRQVENVGYYFAINDYMDATAWLDWRSGARADSLDPGWMRWNGNWNYRWIDRFLNGRIGANHHRLQDGSRSTGLSWQHSQQFTMNRSLTANVNYSTNTSVRRQTSFLAQEVLGTIQSSVTYGDRFGPVSLQVGGTRQQFTGRDEVSQTLPTLTVSTSPISVGEWLVWSPNLSLSNAQRLNLAPQGAYSFRYFQDGSGALDSVALDRDERSSSVNFTTPLEIFGFRWRNSFRVTDVEKDYPEPRLIVDVRDTTIRSTRLFQRTYQTEVYWDTGIELPGLGRGRWNLSPSVSIVNVDPHGFLVRNERTGGEYVRQGKRLQFGLSSRPTIYGLIPGFAGFARFRHAITPSLSWSYAPAADVSDEFLRAIGETRPSYIGNIQQNRLTFGMSQNIEGRLRSLADSTPESGEKVKVLTIDFSPISYDFQRAAEVRRRAREGGRPEPGLLAGFATDRFRYSLRSDLLPGFDVSVDYSLFEGSTQSDTARFAPYREGINASLNFTRESNPWVVLSRIFGKAVPPERDFDAATPGVATDSIQMRQYGTMPLAGESRQEAMMVPQTRGWRANFTFSSQRRRPPRAPDELVIDFDPTRQCDYLRDLNPVQYDLCVERTLANPAIDDTLFETTPGGPVYRYPPSMTLQSSMGMSITEKWSMDWQTMYDFRRRSFASHQVSLQRDLHDWRAIFAFTQSPNGNFAFNFFIALKAQPDLKFDYNSRTYRAGQR